MICFGDFCTSGDVICLAVVASIVILSLILRAGLSRGLTGRDARRSHDARSGSEPPDVLPPGSNVWG